MLEILVVSDLHLGSRYAVMPRKWGGYTANKTQRKILKKWREMCKREKPDLVVVNGDAVDGKQKASSGKELWTTDLDEQIDAAVELVKQINCNQFLVTYGSSYHTDLNLNADQVFAKRLGAEKAGWELNVKTENGTLHFSHQISVSSSAWQYRTTPLAKELVASLLHDDVLPKYKVIVRSHAHYFCAVSFSNNFAVVTPCWQTRTPYMVRKGLGLIPKLGYVVLSSDGEDWMLRAETFDMPKPEVVKIEACGKSRNC